jgi:hypothetical protein
MPEYFVTWTEAVTFTKMVVADDPKHAMLVWSDAPCLVPDSFVLEDSLLVEDEDGNDVTEEA